MISIIVSTYKPEVFAMFTENIAQTIGVEYEIIKIENKGQMGLCEAYNKGKSQAKYPYLCFSHDDIQINTSNWGHYIIQKLKEDSTLGLLGIAGGGYKPWMPSAWFFSGDQRFRRLNISQTDKATGERVRRIDNPNNIITGLDYVVTLDGCWFCTTKDIANQYNFDDKTFKDYHCYDLDYSLQVGEKYKLAVSFDLDIEHFSYGGFSDKWLAESFKLHEKWKDQLPRSCDDPGPDEIQIVEFHAYCFLLSITNKYGSDKSKLKSLLFSIKTVHQVGVKNWLKLLKYTFSPVK